MGGVVSVGVGGYKDDGCVCDIGGDDDDVVVGGCDVVVDEAIDVDSDGGAGVVGVIGVCEVVACVDVGIGGLVSDTIVDCVGCRVGGGVSGIVDCVGVVGVVVDGADVCIVGV